jgi:hypothetical protein
MGMLHILQQPQVHHTSTCSVVARGKQHYYIAFAVQGTPLQAEEVPQGTQAEEVPQGTQAEEVPQGTQAEEVPQGTQAEKVPQAQVHAQVPQAQAPIEGAPLPSCCPITRLACVVGGCLADHQSPRCVHM